MNYVNGTTKICHSTANYPENVFGLSGGSFLKNNLTVACGGGDPQAKITSACYSMSNDLKWTNFANLTTKKLDIASVIVKNGLWVTGTTSLKTQIQKLINYTSKGAQGEFFPQKE